MASDDALPIAGAAPEADLVVDFARAARSLFLAGGVGATFRALVNLAVETVEGCGAASVVLLEKGRLTTRAGTGSGATTIDEIQVAQGEGPCFDAVATSGVFCAEDLAGDPRWPRYGPEAAACGVRSHLALRLSAAGSVGALNLYGACSAAFGPLERAQGLVLVDLGGVAITLAKLQAEQALLADNLHQALATRELVGQAQGILMERERIGAAEAFDILRRASQHLNVKLRDVAEELIATGETPGTGRGPETR